MTTLNAHFLAALEHINALACYGSEEDAAARERVLLEIGEHARQALALNTTEASTTSQATARQDELDPNYCNGYDEGFLAGLEAGSQVLEQESAPEWPKKRDLSASIRESQQRYEIDVMWNNAIDLCRRAALAPKGEQDHG